MSFNPARAMEENCLKNKLIFSVGIQYLLSSTLHLAMMKYLASNLKGRYLAHNLRVPSIMVGQNPAGRSLRQGSQGIPSEEAEMDAGAQLTFSFLWSAGP